MKRSVLFLFSFFSFLHLYGQKASIHGADVSTSDTLGITSFNIRYGEANDGINSWPNRKSLIKNYVQSTRPDILGVQEALIGQIAYLDSIPGYEFVGVGRDNGMTEGEYCAISVFVPGRNLKIKMEKSFVYLIRIWTIWAARRGWKEQD